MGGNAAQRPLQATALILAITGLLALAAVAASGGPPTPRIAVSHTPHGAILIQSNAEFTAANGVVGGHGTPDDPYLIAGWEITNVDTTEAIFIRDTDASFVIRDVYVHQPPGLGFAGIRFIEVSNGRVEDSTVTGFAWDLSLEFTSNLTVARNNLSHADAAIQVWYANDTLPGVVVSDNNLSSSQAGVFVSGGGRAMIVGNLMSNNSYGIRVDGSSNATLAANVLSKNQFQGMLVAQSSNLTIESNDFSGNGAGLADRKSERHAPRQHVRSRRPRRLGFLGSDAVVSFGRR